MTGGFAPNKKKEKKKKLIVWFLIGIDHRMENTTITDLLQQRLFSWV